MTTNQLNYLEYLETERANRAREQVQAREADVRAGSLALDQARLGLEQARTDAELGLKQAEALSKYSTAIQAAEKAGAHTYADLVFEDALKQMRPDWSEAERNTMVGAGAVKAGVNYMRDLVPGLQVLTGLFGG